MKITRRQLRKLIKEMVYVNPKGEAFLPDDIEPYTFMSTHPDQAVSKLGSHPDIQNRKMSALLGGQKWEDMGDREEDIIDLNQSFKDQNYGAPRDEDTQMKNMKTDSRQVEMIKKLIANNKEKIEQVAGDYVFSNNIYNDFIVRDSEVTFDDPEGIALRDYTESFIDDVVHEVLDSVPQISRITKIYDKKLEHSVINVALAQIKDIVHDYLMFDRGLYDMFYEPIGNKK